MVASQQPRGRLTRLKRGRGKRRFDPPEVEGLQFGEVLERRGQGSSSLGLEVVCTASGGGDEVTRLSVRACVLSVRACVRVKVRRLRAVRGSQERY